MACSNLSKVLYNPSFLSLGNPNLYYLPIRLSHAKSTFKLLIQVQLLHTTYTFLHHPLKMATPSLPLAGKVALITGGSKGIGRATSLHLARDGAKIVVNYSSSSKDADEVVSLIGDSQAIAIKADVSNVTEIGKLVDATVAKWGKIDILVACAGVMRLNELESVTEEEYDMTFGLNVKGPMFLVQVLCPSPRKLQLKKTDLANIEITPTHVPRLPRRALLNHPSTRQYRNPQLPHLRSIQRRHRANDTRAVKRSRAERYHG